MRRGRKSVTGGHVDKNEELGDSKRRKSKTGSRRKKTKEWRKRREYTEEKRKKIVCLN